MMRFRVEARTEDGAAWCGHGDTIAEALAYLVDAVAEAAQEPRAWIREGAVREELEEIHVPWAGELHPLPDVLRFIRAEARMVAARYEQLLEWGVQQELAIRVAEGERDVYRIRAVRQVLERELEQERRAAP